jgi:hypothetical protein
MPDERLATEAIDGGSERLVEIEACREFRSECVSANSRSEDDALHDVRRTQIPYVAGKHHIVGIMDLAQMVP